MLDALRLGTHQLLSMRVPSHAAISTTVDLVRARVELGRRPASPTRCSARCPRTTSTTWIEQVAPDPRTAPTGTPRSPTATRAGSSTSCAGAVGDGRAGRPARGRQRAAPGDPGRPARARRPATSCRASRRRTRRTAWCCPAATPARSRRSPRAAPASRTRAPSWSRWCWPRRRSRARTRLWLDLCAGPGGKAALLAALAAERGAALVAAERQPHRAGLVRRALDRAPTACRRASPPTAPRRRTAAGRFDRVLVDAPCTGLGALRRRPEARWRRQPDDLLALVLLQRRWSPRRSTWSGPAESCSTRPARRCSPRPRAWSPRSLSTRTDVVLEDAAPLLPDVPDCAGPMPGHRPAVAAPARHRRDVPGAAAGVLTRRV